MFFWWGGGNCCSTKGGALHASVGPLANFLGGPTWPLLFLKVHDRVCILCFRSASASRAQML